MLKSENLLMVTGVLALLIMSGCASKEPSSETEKETVIPAKEPVLRMGEERVVFTGTVEAVELLGQREATVYPVGVDPKFLMVLRVNSVKQNRSSPITGGKSVSFAIHSPSELLGTGDSAGREFRFTATWVFGPEKEKRFSWMQAVPVTGSK